MENKTPASRIEKLIQDVLENTPIKHDDDDFPSFVYVLNAAPKLARALKVAITALKQYQFVDLRMTDDSKPEIQFVAKKALAAIEQIAAGAAAGEGEINERG